MDNLPLYISIFFGLTLITAIAIFYKAAHSSKRVLAIIVIWAAIQSVISITGFYKIENTIPPRFGLLLMPPLALILLLFITKRGKAFIDRLDIKTLTLFQIIRIPVELTLLWLCIHKAIPELMTFEGRNFDILSGISAPIIYYFTFVKRKMGTSVLLIWNLICLALLLNIAFNAILSLPTVFQQFAFEQPNIALLQFPFTLLPSVLVPLVMFSHLAAIKQITSGKNIIITNIT